MVLSMVLQLTMTDVFQIPFQKLELILYYFLLVEVGINKQETYMFGLQYGLVYPIDCLIMYHHLLITLILY